MNGYRRLVANTLATLGGRMANVVIALVLSTLLFRWLGPARYGLWSFFFVFVSYSSLVDLGLATTLERSVARFRWQKDREGIEESLNLGLLAMLGFSLVLQSVVLVLPGSFWARFEQTQDVRRLALALPLCLLMTNTATVAGAGLAGIQEMGLLNAVRTGVNILRTLAVLVLAAAGTRRLDVLLLVYSLGAVAGAMVCWRLLGRAVGIVHLRAAVGRRGLAREFFRFGGAVQASTFASQAGDQILRLLLGARFGASTMGLYDLGTRAAIAPRSLSSVLLTALVPFGTETHLGRGADGVSRLHQFAVKYTAFFILNVTALGLYFSRPVIELWLGHSASSEAVLFVFRVFLVAHAAGSLAGPATMLGRAVGRPQLEAIAAILGASIGFTAAAAAPSFPSAVALFASAQVLAFLALWRILARRIGLEPVARREFVSLAASVAGTVLATAFADFLLAAWGAGPAVRVGLSSAIGLAAASAVAWASRFITPPEREFWSGIAKQGRARLESRPDQGSS